MCSVVKHDIIIVKKKTHARWKQTLQSFRIRHIRVPSLGPVVNILFMLIIYILKISIIKDKGIGSPLLISVDIFDQETRVEKMIRLEPRLTGTKIIINIFNVYFDPAG